MSTLPKGTKRDHQKFCTTEKWELVRGATGKLVGHHLTFELVLYDGRILRTRISHPVNNTTYGASLWNAILKRQLEVTAAAFWACVNHGTLPERGAALHLRPPGRLPLHLVDQLIHTVGVPEDEVVQMSMNEATQRLADYWLHYAAGDVDSESDA